MKKGRVFGGLETPRMATEEGESGRLAEVEGNNCYFSSWVKAVVTEQGEPGEQLLDLGAQELCWPQGKQQDS